MAAAEALRRCPRAVFVRPRHSLYGQYSQEVWTAVREVVPTVERTGLDEGYLDVGEVAADFGRARVVAEAVQAAVRGATSLSCSLGVASSKVVAKIGSDRRKPGGLTVLPDAELKRLLPGKLGPLLRDRARGIDPRPLETTSETISISTEETFDRDIADVEQLKAEVRRMAERVAERLEKGSQTARTVTTKVRYPDFSIRSRSTTLPVATDDGARIAELACGLLDRALADRPGALRLVGVGVSGLEGHRQLALLS